MGTVTGFDRRSFKTRGRAVGLTPAGKRHRARKASPLRQVTAASAGIGLIAVAAASLLHPGAHAVTALQQVPAVRALTHNAIQVCSGGGRRARQVTCLVDGDTGWEQGVKWRLTNIDTPELSKPQCRHERATAIAARNRLRDLMSGGYSIAWTGARGYYGRALVSIRLADGRDAAQVLLEERLAQPWPNSGNVWCAG